MHMESLLKEETEGEFEIDRLLGKGGMAMVYLAREVHLDRKVAIKVLPPELTFGHGVERFKREAKTAAALDHAHIIPIYRIASGGKLFWYAMKFLEGRSLEQYLREKNRLSLEETIRILDPVCRALEYAHEHQVIHRDIKPANVMLDMRDRVTVTDFGIAKALTEGTLTASGSVIGTPFYMSPEQGMGKQVTGASDQYSVAVMAYRMLSGQVPFEGDSAIDILHKHCTVPPPPLDVLRPDLPQHVYGAINKALAKKAEARFSTVTVFVEGLKEMSPEISGEMATIAVDTDPSIQDRISTEVISLPSKDSAPEAKKPEPRKPIRPPKPKKKSRVPLMAILALIVIGGGAGGFWFLTQQGRSSTPQQQAGGEDPGVTPAGGGPGASDETVAESTATPDPVIATGTVTVAELPQGGWIEVDGERQQGNSFELQAGDYTLRMAAPGRQVLEMPVAVTPGQSQTIRYTGTAIPTTGTVTVSGLPGNGSVSIDGRTRSGRSFELREGTYSIVMSAPGYVADRRRVTVESGTSVPLRFAGQREAAPAPDPAIVLIRIRPWANVRIGSRTFSQVSVVEDTLPPGAYTIVVTRDGFVDENIPVNLRAGQVDTILVRLQRNPR
jgi:serine/threonine protein kinase